jgi:hypothetical protein
MRPVVVSPRTPEILALAWHPARLEIWAAGTEVPGGTEQRATIDLAVSPDQRYDLFLCTAASGRGWMRAPVGPRSLFIRMDDHGHTLIPLPPPPGEKALALHQGWIHHRNQLFVIDGSCLFVLTQNGAWRKCIMPEGFVAYDADFDSDGGLWITGALLSTRLPNASTEAAILYQAHGSDILESRSPKLSWLSAAMAIRNGGLEALRTVNAGGEPLVATSDCAWLFDDPSSFLFLLNTQGHWSVHRLPGRSIRTILRPTSLKLLVVTVKGDLLVIEEDQKLKQVGTAAALCAALRLACPNAPTDAQLLVRGADADKNNVLVAAGLYTLPAGEMHWLVTALCHSSDSGANWTVIAKTAPVDGDPEFLDVGILHPESDET